MAGDWIKVEHGLIDKPEVMEMADLLQVSSHEVVGHLVAFWCWVDANLSPDCPQVKGTTRGLDRVAGRDGFATALVRVGWLEIENGLIGIPNYELHLSKSAKSRAKEQRKKSLQRSKVSPVCPQQQGTTSGRKQGPEKRREEKSITHTHRGKRGSETRPPRMGGRSVVEVSGHGLCGHRPTHASNDPGGNANGSFEAWRDQGKGGFGIFDPEASQIAFGQLERLPGTFGRVNRSECVKIEI